MKTKNIFKSIVFSSLSLLIISCGGGDLTDLANNNLYPFATANKTEVPDKALDGFKDLQLNFNDGEQDLEIHGWTYTKSQFSPTLVYLHGNATNIGSLHKGGITSALKAMGGNVVVIDYPSYGKSKGQPTMRSLTASAGEALRWADKNFKGDIIVWGRSLGTGVASQVVKDYGNIVDGYILTSPWSTVKDLIKHHFNSLADQVPEEWMAANTYESTEALKRSKKPGIIFHGNKDKVIPYKFGQKLYENIEDKSKVDFVTMDGYEHNDVFQSTEMWQAIKDFVNR